MTKDTYKTLVVFRKFNVQGDIIALFPAIPYNNIGDNCESYQRIGQHGAANYAFCMTLSVSATPKEYLSLKQELESIGYNLDVRKRYMPRRGGGRKTG